MLNGDDVTHNGQGQVAFTGNRTSTAASSNTKNSTATMNRRSDGSTRRADPDLTRGGAV